jgi:hypothetical protein
MTNLTYELSGLVDGELYDLIIYAANESGNSLDSSATQVLIIPAIPTGLAVTAGTTSLNYSFNQMYGATGYKLYYGTTSAVTDGSVTISGVSNVTGSITGLTAGVQYYVKVTARNDSGESDKSAAVTQYVVPAAPTGFVAVGGVNKIDVSFNAVTQSVGYNVYYTLSGSTSYTKHNSAIVTQTQYPITGLSAGTAYTVMVRSVRLSTVDNQTQIESANSSTLTRFTIADIPAITSVTAASTTSLSVAFTPETGADTYTVYYGTATGVLSSTKTLVTSSPTTITGLTAGVKYFVAVSSLNAAGESAKSTEVAEYTVPAAPVTLSLTPGVGKLTATYGAVSEANGYNIYYRTGTDGFVKHNGTVLQTVNTYELSGLSNGTAYDVYVKAVRLAVTGGSQVESAQSTTQTASTVAAVTSITSTSAMTNTITVNFSSVTGATSYKVYYGTADGVHDLSKANVTGTSTTLTGLTAGTTYYIAMTSINSGGESVKSAEVSRITRALPPTSLVAVGKVQAIDISFVAATGASSYDIRMGISGQADQFLANITGTTYTASSLLAGTFYNFRIMSKNNSGDSETFSNVATATTIAAIPTIASSTATATSITVSINGVTGVTGYKVYYGTSAGSLGSSESISTTSAGVVQVTLPTLSSGIMYYFAAVSVNAAGESARTSIADRITVPGQPSFVSVSGGVENAYVTIAAQTGAVSYKVYYGLQGVYDLSQAFAVRTGYINNLIDGKVYNFKLTALNESGESAFSPEVFERVIPDQPGAATIGAVGSFDKITVKFRTIEGASSYVVYYGLSGDFSQSKEFVAGSTTTVSGENVSGEVMTVDFSGFEAGKFYSFRYTAKKTDANSPNESALSTDIAYARIAPATPSFVSVVGGVKKATVTFTPVVGATRYIVKYKKAGDSTYTEYPAFFV